MDVNRSNFEEQTDFIDIADINGTLFALTRVMSFQYNIGLILSEHHCTVQHSYQKDWITIPKVVIPFL